jgi:glycosyltransferase involved in cell wall biosynthesis
MSSVDSLRVAIDARVSPASAGGVAQVILGLVRALGRIDDSATSYSIVIESESERDFLKSHLGNNQQFVVKTRSVGERVHGLLTRSKSSISRQLFGNDSHYQTSIAISDGFIESVGCDVVHFPHQRFVLCGLPSIYNPHDLQHLHFPQFFTPSEIAWREMTYRLGCQVAHTVPVSSRWVKDDIIQHYQIDSSKIQIIPWAPPTEAYKDPAPTNMSRVREKYGLEEPFALYPAMTWPHKNHLRLLEALSLLRNTGRPRVRIVCTGSLLQPYYAAIQARVRELGLEAEVRFLGYVPDDDLRVVYRLAQFLVMPSLFESDSSPVYEAWLEGTPIACSNVTSLPIQIMDAGLLFDPNDPEAIASVMAQLANDKGVRENLSDLGRVRIKDYDWERTAKAYRAVYRRAARRALSDEDRWLLNWDWMERPSRLLEAHT